MPATVNLHTLKEKLESDLEARELALDATLLVDVPYITAFISTLPDPRIVLQDVELTHDETATPPTLTLAGRVTTRWLIRGLNGPGILPGRLTFRFTQVSPTAAILANLDFEDAELTISDQAVNLRGWLYPRDREAFNAGDPAPRLKLLLQEGEPPQLSLPALVLMAGEVGVGGLLPADQPPFNQTVPLTELTLLAGPQSDGFVIIRVASEMQTYWDVIPNVLSLTQIGFGFENRYYNHANGTPGRSTSAVILGKLAIGDFSYDVRLVLGHSKQEIYVIGTPPPSLADMATFAGGEDLKNALKENLKTIGMEPPTIDDVRIHLNIRKRKLNLIVVRGSLVLAGARFIVYVQLPRPYLYGQLAAGEQVSFKALVEHYLGEDSSIPAIDLTYLRVAASPQSGTYELEGNLATDWPVALGETSPLVLTSVELLIKRTPKEVTGHIQAGLNLAGADFLLRAERSDAATGWRFSGYALSQEGLSVDTLLRTLGELFDFDTGQLELPPALRAISFRNPSLIFSLKQKDFAFACEVVLPVADKASYPAGEIVVLIQFAFDGSTKKAALGWSIVSINLSNLPLIRERMTPSQKLAINKMQMHFASRAFTDPELGTLNLLLSGYSGAPTLTTLKPRLNFSAELEIDGAANRFEYPVNEGGQFGTPAPATPVLMQNDGVMWYPINKKIGLAHFKRIGVYYKNGSLALLLDVTVRTGPVNMSVLGLMVTIPLDSFEPRFAVQGLGVSYEDVTREIGASLLKGTIDFEDTVYTAYSGGGYLKLKPPAENVGIDNKKGGLTLSVMGSFIQMDDPSLLFYATLDKAIGGSPFFYVTGLAVGFGFNRKLNLPPLYRLPEFPLISAALDPKTDSGDIGVELRKLAPYIPPARGDYFFALGVKGTTFELVETFALLSFSGGRDFRIDVLGTSRVLLPPRAVSQTGLPEVVRLELPFHGVFDPRTGFLGLQGQLTPNSFIFSRDCRLMGGFAFNTWFSGPHEGDFVQTVGGYHPDFTPPAHYPVVPRISFHWQVDAKTQIKGSLYYALTPRAVMAGGQLEAAYQSGKLKAWFRLGADFLMSWQPFTYAVRARDHWSLLYLPSVWRAFQRFSGCGRRSPVVGAGLWWQGDHQPQHLFI